MLVKAIKIIKTNEIIYCILRLLKSNILPFALNDDDIMTCGGGVVAVWFNNVINWLHAFCNKRWMHPVFLVRGTAFNSVSSAFHVNCTVHFKLWSIRYFILKIKKWTKTVEQLWMVGLLITTRFIFLYGNIEEVSHRPVTVSWRFDLLKVFLQ